MKWRQREETAQTRVTDGLFKDVTFELRLEQGATPEKMWVESILSRKNSEGKDQDRNNSANLKNSMKANVVGP